MIQAEVAAGRLGVFWHTQGSGKSYSMVFLTEKIHRKLSAAWSFVIVTDRAELDDQIDANEQQLTREVFGDYVSICDFQRAVADGATLPLFYENAGEKLKIVDPRLSERIAEYIETAKQAATLDDPWTDAKEDKLYRELARDYPILTAPAPARTKASRKPCAMMPRRWPNTPTAYRPRVPS